MVVLEIKQHSWKLRWTEKGRDGNRTQQIGNQGGPTGVVLGSRFGWLGGLGHLFFEQSNNNSVAKTRARTTLEPSLELPQQPTLELPQQPGEQLTLELPQQPTLELPQQPREQPSLELPQQPQRALTVISCPTST